MVLHFNIQQEPAYKKPYFKKPQTDFLSLAPFYKKLDRLIKDRFPPRINNQTKSLFEL